MSDAPEPSISRPRDPLGWTIAATCAFLGLVSVRLTIPTEPLFDETHYLPAARAILGLSHPLNTEHPPLGRDIALGSRCSASADRLASDVRAVRHVAFLRAIRAVWFATLSRFAAFAFAVLWHPAFRVVQARIAMLDISWLSSY